MEYARKEAKSKSVGGARDILTRRPRIKEEKTNALTHPLEHKALYVPGSPLPLRRGH